MHGPRAVPAGPAEGPDIWGRVGLLPAVLAGRLHFQLVFLSFVGLGILWSLVPRRREKWIDPGPRFTAETQPELAELVRRVADAVGQGMPADLYLGRPVSD